MEINHLLTQAKTRGGLRSADQDYVLMYAIARAFQVRRVVEIGTYQGAAAIAFCQAIRDNGDTPELWTIDDWRGAARNVPGTSIPNRKSVIECFAEAEVLPYVTIVEGNSRNVLPGLLQEIGPVDLCFIDGDHTVEGARADYCNCRDHSPLLLFHDSSWTALRTVLNQVREDGWHVTDFPTRYLEGDGHEVGIALAQRSSRILPVR